MTMTDRPASLPLESGRRPPARIRGDSSDSFTFIPSKNFLFYIPSHHSGVLMETDSRTEIDLTDEVDRWRYTCPHGHREWEPTNHHFWCAACGRADVAATFDTLRDRKTGRELAREDIRLVDPTGPYDRELDRERGGVSV